MTEFEFNLIGPGDLLVVTNDLMFLVTGRVGRRVLAMNVLNYTNIEIVYDGKQGCVQRVIRDSGYSPMYYPFKRNIELIRCE